MDSPLDPSRTRVGRYVTTIAFNESVNAYVPPALPPSPPLEFSGLMHLLSQADRAIGRLDGIAMMLPDKALFLYLYVRKEAVLSSQIEGTQSTLDDLLRFENAAIAGRPIADITEVSNYVDAMTFGLARMRDPSPQGLPLCLRLLREMHERLLRSGRGESKNSGEFRSSQNWLGGSRPGNATYVPPPVQEMQACLSDLEKFMQDDTSALPPLIKAGLLHVQFESIHPFLDGNGRLGRLLIALYLVDQNVLKEPLLYLSLYFKTHRGDYYKLLQEVRERGTWEAWLEFFLKGVTETANNAFASAMRIVTLFKQDRDRISVWAEHTNSMLCIHELMQAHPFVSAAQVAEKTRLSVPTVNTALAALQNLGVVREVTGKLRGRVFAYQDLLKLLDDGTAVSPASS